jgi:hypothetical protein
MAVPVTWTRNTVPYMKAPDIREAMNSTDDFRKCMSLPDISERNAWQVNRICMKEPHDTAFYFGKECLAVTVT